MVNLITSLPGGLLPPFAETESNELPVVRVEGKDVVIPVLCRKETRYEYTEGEEESAREVEVFRYWEVRTRYLGGDVNDYDFICRNHYSGIRSAFYGSPEYQADIDYDHNLTAHVLAVKDAFRKPGQTTPPEGIARWEQIKSSFWAIIDEVLESVGKTRDDLPAYFNDTAMFEWAKKNKVPNTVIEKAETELLLVSSNLGANKRNWEELFK